MFAVKTFAYWLEFLLLFFGVPLFLMFEKSIIHPSSILLPVLVGLILYFRKQKDFKLIDLVRLDITKTEWMVQGAVLVLVALALSAYVVLIEPENLFNLPKGNPGIWIAMFFFYPIFSAYGQEVVYRKFLFMRYQAIFRKKWMMILASGIAFSFVHIVYFSTLSLVLTFIAGIYLALVYQKTKSVLFVAILHGLMGFFIFTIGLGQHFWLDMMDWL
jgi:membrane protease YdiL (CAAX protease family)